MNRENYPYEKGHLLLITDSPTNGRMCVLRGAEEFKSRLNCEKVEKGLCTHAVGITARLTPR